MRLTISAGYCLLLIGVAILSSGTVVEAEAPPPAESHLSSRLTPPMGRVDMVLDSDMYNEVDDQFALAYALQSAERVNLKAVCAAPFLNHRSKSAGDGMEQSYQETHQVLQLLEHPDKDFVFRGATHFLANRHTPADSPAARRIIELAKTDRQGPLYVVGLGAATNIASALLIEPSIAERIVVVWIGGHPYHWPNALDFNLKQDVAAAQVLFDCGVPLVHVPAGDVAASLTITLPELEAGLKGKSPIATKLFDNVERYYTETGANKKQPRSGENAWQKVIWDIATIAWLIAPESLVKSKVVASPVLTGEGTWKQSDARHPVRVAVSLDREAIYQDLFTKLGKPYVYSYLIEPTWGPKTPAQSKFGFEVHHPGRIHLARVPKSSILTRNRYEFFAGLNDRQQPTWSANVADKHAVFRDDSGVGWNVSVSFDVGLKRYLLATT